MTQLKPDRAPALLQPGAVTEPLDPARLDARAIQAVQAFLKQGESANTRASYRSAVRYWLAWFEARYGKEMTPPVHPATVIQFIVDHAQHRGEGQEMHHQLPQQVDSALIAAGVKAKAGPMSLNTLKHRLAALARLHRDRTLHSPTEEAAVRRLLSSVRRAYAKGGNLGDKKDALDADLLQRLLATCDDTPLGVRDRALLSFGFATGGRRRSEVASASFAQLRPTSQGFDFDLAHSKTNQGGADRPENHKPLVGAAAAAMRSWLQLLAGIGITAGPIFRRVRRGGLIGAPLTDSAVRRIVLRRCELAGVEGEFSAHSLRAGFMTQAGRSGIPLAEAMAFSGHRDVKTALGYVQQGEMQKSAAARLLEE